MSEVATRVLPRIRPQGLTSTQAATRLAQDGPNAVAKPRPRRLPARIAAQLADPLVALLLAAAVVTVLLGDLTDTAVILLVVTLNTAIGVTQQVRADRAIAALDQLTSPTARVVRDGADLTVPAADLVVGDWVRLEAGDIIPADVLVHDAQRCQVDEAALTGESVPVARSAGEELFSGTVLVTGRVTGEVARTGAHSALGRIATLVATANPGPTPLQRKLAQLGRRLGGIVVLLCVLVFAIGIGAGQAPLTMGLVAVSLVVAAIPESLPAVVTLALALGARRMARRRAIPRNLHSVEALGSVTVIAADKTGTLTQGRMAVRAAVTGSTPYRVDGLGYAPVGVVDGPGGRLTGPPPADLTELAQAAVLCSDAAVLPPGADHPEWTAVGDPMEAALVTFAHRCGLDPQAVREAAPRQAERPFDQATRQMTTVHQVSGGYLTVCKGAPETVLTSPVTQPGQDVESARQAAAELAGEGLRVIAVAAGLSERPSDPDRLSGLKVLGVVGIGDPLRDTAADTAARFARAGIRLMLITGDHPATAAAIAGQVGIWRDGDPIAAGDQSHRAHEVSVFARTQPEQKLEIVAWLQRNGHVVAMTGDGVNDAPALRRADIGVAMGGGTEVARQAADLVLVDDNLGTVAVAVHEGRRVYDNIRRFLRYALAGGAAEIAVMLLGPLFGLAVPLLPGQILWINLLTHGLPGVALGAEPAEPDVLRRPPRPPDEQVLGVGLLRQVLALGALLTVATLAVGWWAYGAGRPWQSMVFMVLGLSQLGLALAVRATRARGARGGNFGLLLAVALSAAAQFAGVLLSPLRTLLGTEPLSAGDLGICVAVAVVPGLLLLLFRRWYAGKGVIRAATAR